MKKVLSIILSVMLLVVILSAFVGAEGESKLAVVPTYKVELNGIEVEDSLYNIDGNTYFRGRTLEKAGVNVDWDESNKVAKFDVLKAEKSIDLYETQKAVVRIAVQYGENGKEIAVIGNGFFIPDDKNGSRKILTTRDVYDTYKFVLGNNNVGTDTGDPYDTITNVTGIKIILWDDTIKDAKNFRFDDDMILGTLDTMGYTSKDVVKFGENMKVEDTTYMCTSIESNTFGNNENHIQVANQWSSNKVLRVRYPRDNQYFTLIKNNTDNADSGRGGAIFNSKGQLTGIFCAVEDGNNGNCLVKPVSEIKEFLND